MCCQLQKEAARKPMKAHSSMLLPGCCLVMMRFGVLTTILRRYDLWKPMVSNEVVSYKCLGTLEPKKVTQLNSKTWENSSQMPWLLFHVVFRWCSASKCEFFGSFEGQELDEWHEEEGAGANSNIFGIFTPKIGEDFQFHQFFSDGLVQPPTRSALRVYFTKETG